MLDEFGCEMDVTESKLDSTMRKVAKVMHISNGEFHQNIQSFDQRPNILFLDRQQGII